MHRNLAREPGRKNLITHFDSHPNLITICSYGYDKNYDPPPEFSQEKLTNQVSFSNLPKDELGNEKGISIRWQSLSYQPNLSNFANNCKTPNSFSLSRWVQINSRWGGRVLPSKTGWYHRFLAKPAPTKYYGFFAMTYLLLALRFLENQGIKSAITQNQEWLIDNVTFPKLANRTAGYQNLKGLVSQVLLNYRANPKPAFKVTLQEVLSGKITSDLVKDKIVLIAHTSEVSKDYSNPKW